MSLTVPSNLSLSLSLSLYLSLSLSLSLSRYLFFISPCLFFSLQPRTLSASYLWQLARSACVYRLHWNLWASEPFKGISSIHSFSPHPSGSHSLYPFISPYSCSASAASLSFSAGLPRRTNLGHLKLPIALGLRTTYQRMTLVVCASATYNPPREFFCHQRDNFSRIGYQVCQS